MIRKILHVTAMEDFSVTCEMENGEVYKYDMSFIKTETGEVMEPLREVAVFKKVWVDDGALEWPSGLGIHGNTVAWDGVLISKAA